MRNLLQAFAAVLLGLLLGACNRTYQHTFSPEQASWIGINTPDSLRFDSTHHAALPATYLTHTFDIDETPRQATMFLSVGGYAKCYINGSEIDNAPFGTVASDYDKTVYYNRYDITRLLHKGENSIDIILTHGWFTSLLPDYRMPDYGNPRVKAQIIISSRRDSLCINTDTTWLATNKGPIRIANLYDGETYNALYEDSLCYATAEIMTAPKGIMRPQQTPSQATLDTITPIRVWQTERGTQIVDMGENMVGWLSLRAEGQKGCPVIIRMAETLLPDSDGIYTRNLRHARATNTYIPRTDGQFSYCPISTYQGFRYAEISGLSNILTTDDIQGIYIGNPMKQTGSFRCSNETLNSIYDAAVRGIKGNYHDFPTDCPQRDERLGWLGDRFTGCVGESFVYDNHSLYLKWLQDIEDTQTEEGQLADIAPQFWGLRRHQNVTWTGAYIAVADMLLTRYGDTTAVKRHYDSMKRYIRYTIANTMRDSLLTVDTYGDWCMPPEDLSIIHSKDPARQTDPALLSSATMYHLLGIMQRFALLIEQTGDAAEFMSIAEQIRTAYNRRFYDYEKHSYSNGTATANIISLYYGLTPDGEQQPLTETIAHTITNRHDSHVCCGVIGMQCLMRGLTRNGYAPLAYRIATRRTFPSWGYMTDNGATTIWELWNGNTAAPEMNSGNHVMLLGDFIVWLYEDLCGIRPAENGYKTIEMQPYFAEDLTFAEAAYNSPAGKIVSRWKRLSDDKESEDYNRIEWHISLPRGVTATVILPDGTRHEIKGEQTIEITM